MWSSVRQSREFVKRRTQDCCAMTFWMQSKASGLKRRDYLRVIKHTVKLTAKKRLIQCLQGHFVHINSQIFLTPTWLRSDFFFFELMNLIFETGTEPLLYVVFLRHGRVTWMRAVGRERMHRCASDGAEVLSQHWQRRESCLNHRGEQRNR